MNRNSEYNFAENPQVGVSRSRFQRNSDSKTTFNAGDLIPIYLDEVLPGDTHQIDVACVMRMATPIFPVMANSWAWDFGDGGTSTEKNPTHTYAAVGKYTVKLLS